MITIHRAKAGAGGILWTQTGTVSVITIIHRVKAGAADMDAAPDADMETVSGADEADNKRDHYEERTGDNQSH